MISHSSNAPQIFFIDAKPESNRELSADLQESGYEVQSFESGKSALRMSQIAPPDLWVVSMSLPDISGPELVSMLRWRYPQSKICLVSDEYRVNEEIDARCSGPEMYFAKPINSNWLLEAIGDATSAKQ